MRRPHKGLLILASLAVCFSVIVAEKVTDSTTGDASVVPDLLDQIPDDKKIERFTADGAYDQSSIYKTFVKLGARIVVPPVKTATPSRARTRGAKARNRNINRVRKVGGLVAIGQPAVAVMITCSGVRI